MKPIRFIHIEKSGGTSVRDFLLKHNVNFLLGKNTKMVRKHSHAVMFENENSFKFCMVRNPYTRLVSFYNYTAHNLIANSFEDFVCNHLYHPGKQLNPQVMKIYKQIDTNLQPNNIRELEQCFDWNNRLVDKIFYLENIQEFLDFFKIKDKFPQMNISTYDDHMAYYTEELKEKVYNFYKKDFEILGYAK